MKDTRQPEGRNVKPLLTIIALLTLAAAPVVPMTPQERYDEAEKKLTSASNEEERFYALGTAAKAAFALEKFSEAREYATELGGLTPKFKGNWNYGNAVHDVNLIIGRLAFRQGDVKQAKAFLLEAGKTPGSPQLNSFGPNMGLAKDLLERNGKRTVLEYFDLCRSFWKMDQGRLDQWSKEVEAGKIPDFGANLLY
jgi:tetratricopeptide (TPR) repeat protein